MVLLETKGHSRIVRDRQFQDYNSLKEYFQLHRIEEFLYEGYHLSAGGVAEIQADTTTATEYIAAEAQVFIRSETDLAALDGDSIYIDYYDDDGVIHTIESLLDIAGGAGTDTEVPLGNENVLDTVAAVDAFTVTLTALNPGLNAYAGKYMVVYSGDQVGTNSLIVSNTADNPTVLTVADSQNANLADDLISIQTDPCEDFYRLRSMNCETEAPADNNIWLCDKDKSHVYGVISDANTQAAITRYFVPAATTGQNTRYFLGKIEAKATIINEGDTTATGFIVDVRYTPKALNSNVPAADVLQSLEFNELLNWQPCIELEPATDVIIRVGDLGTAGYVHLSISILEVNRFES